MLTITKMPVPYDLYIGDKKKFMSTDCGLKVIVVVLASFNQDKALVLSMIVKTLWTFISICGL